MTCSECPYNNAVHTGRPYCPLPKCLYKLIFPKKEKPTNTAMKEGQPNAVV